MDHWNLSESNQNWNSNIFATELVCLMILRRTFCTLYISEMPIIHTSLPYDVIEIRVTNMFGKPHYKRPIFHGLISRVLLEIETRGRVFCIAPAQVTICLPNGTFGLLYNIYFQYRVTLWTPEIVQRVDILSKSVSYFCGRCILGWVLGG